MQKLISVALDVPINHLFDYITENQDIKVGYRVEVPFGRSKRIGIVLEVESFKIQESAYKIKKIYKVIDKIPLLSMEIIKTCKWAASYYHYPMGQVLFNAMSPIHRKGLLSPDKKLLLDKKNIEIYNQGKHERDFTYIDDAINLIFKIFQNFFFINCRIFNHF